MAGPDAAANKTKSERLDRRTELIAALILSTAALASSYAGFQAALWDGEQAGNYTLAEQARTAAANAEALGGEAVVLDMLLFTEWLDAYARGDDRVQGFYREQFRPKFAESFDQWLALRPRTNSAAPRSPFAMPSYVPQVQTRARVLQERADRYFAAGERANDNSDAYVQATVILALALFMAGIIQSFQLNWLRITLLAVGAFCCVIGIAKIVALPALRLSLGT